MVPTAGGERGEGADIYIYNRYVHCHHQNDFRIKIGSDVSHFTVLSIVQGQSQEIMSINHNL